MTTNLISDHIHCIDVTSWKGDENHPFFSIGARDKQMVWSPDDIQDTYPKLKPNWPYLFKQSINRYPDQYWTEVVASVVGIYLDVAVPMSYPAQQRQEDGSVISGCLLEWFYNPEEETLEHGSNYFKQLINNFDNDKGTQHNLESFIALNAIVYNTMKKLSDSHNANFLYPEPFHWLSEMIAFDTLIGNTDRHQENWGYLISKSGVTLSSLYDNGTSLGHERFIENVRNWDDNRLKQYIMRANHHMKYDLGDNMKRIPHFEIFTELKTGNIIQLPKEVRFTILGRVKRIIEGLDLPKLLYDIHQLSKISCLSPISPERIDWINRIITMRYDIIKEHLNDVY